MGPRLRACLVGAIIGLLAVAALAWATLAGITTLGFRGDLVALAAALVALVLLFVTQRRPITLAAIVFLAALTLSFPASVVVYDLAIADAQAYCASGATGSPPALAQPGFSQRYTFELGQSHGESRCRFPDPLGPRVHWTGTSMGGPWHWEKLMD